MNLADLNLNDLESYKTLPKIDATNPFFDEGKVYIESPIEVRNFCTYENNKLLINVDINTGKIDEKKFPININININ